MKSANTCIPTGTCCICGATATSWRAFMPYQTYPARIAWLCADHVAVSREAFHGPCIVHPDNADVARYETRNRQAIEREHKQAKRLSAKRKAAITKRWKKCASGKPSNDSQFVSKTPQIQAEDEIRTPATFELELQP